MLCGCANPPVEPPRSTSTTSTQVDVLHHGGGGGAYSDARRLIVPSPPVSLRRRFSVRVQPSAGARGPEPSRQSGDGSPRTRSYTLTDGATSAIGRILTTCFHDAHENGGDADGAGSSEDLSARSRPRSRSLWSRRRSPAAGVAVSCLPASSSPGGGAAAGRGCVVDVVLDCSPGTVRRRRLENQSAASSTSSTLHCSDLGTAAAPRNAVTRPASRHDSEVLLSDLTAATSSERLLSRAADDAHPVWERRQTAERDRPVRQRAAPAVPHSAPSTVIPAPQDRPTPSKTAPPRRRITSRATTCAVPLPKVRVVQTTSGGGPLVKTENGREQYVKPTTSSRVSRSMAYFKLRCDTFTVLRRLFYISSKC